MSEEKNDKWLEEIISKTINSGKPQFDVEKFKHKFPEEIQQLQSRANKPAKKFQGLFILKRPVIKFAAAAAIILITGLFIYKPKTEDNENKATITNEFKTPSELLTSTSLMNAYLKGGMEAVDEKNRQAAKMLNQKPEDITIYELLIENNNI